MGPPNKILLPDNLDRELGDIRRRLLALETGNAIPFTQVLIPIGLAHWSPSSTSSQGYQDIPGSVVPFTLPRPATVLVFCVYYGKTTGGSGNYTFMQLRIGSHTQVVDWGDAPQIFDVAGGASFGNGFDFFTAPLPAGASSAALQVGVQAGQTCLIQVGMLIVFSLGA